MMSIVPHRGQSNWQDQQNTNKENIPSIVPAQRKISMSKQGS